MHAKLRIISRLIGQLIDEASLLEQELLVSSLSLKLAEDDLKLFEDYVPEVDEQTTERQALFDKTSEELYSKAVALDGDFEIRSL